MSDVSLLVCLHINELYYTRKEIDSQGPKKGYGQIDHQRAYALFAKRNLNNIKTPTD